MQRTALPSVSGKVPSWWRRSECPAVWNYALSWSKKNQQAGNDTCLI